METTMYQQVDFDFSLESISNYLLDDNSEKFFDEYDLEGFPVFGPNDLSFSSIYDKESSINKSGSSAEYSPSSGLISPYSMDEPIDPFPHLDDSEINGLLNEIFPITNIPCLETDTSQTFLPSIDVSIISMSRNRDLTIENEYNSNDARNAETPTLLSLSSDRRKYRGVVKRPREKFTAEIRNPKKKGSKLWLGTYKTPEEAAMAYDRAAFKLRGTHAKLNFPHLLDSHNDNPEKYVIKKRSISSTSSSSSSSDSLKNGGQRKRRK